MTSQQEQLSILADVCICAGCLLYELEGCKCSSLIGKSVVNKLGRLPKRNASLSKFFFYGSTERYTSYFYREMNHKYRVQII